MNKKNNNEYILIIDTETTGLPEKKDKKDLFSPQ